MTSQYHVTVIKHSLTIEGLSIRYRYTNGCTILHFDPFSTCAMLQEAGIIEGFDTDGYEPVVLFTHPDVRPYGHELWVHFVKRFCFDDKHAQAIANWHYEQKIGISIKAKSKKAYTKKSVPLLYHDVLPPLKLYNLHNYYYEHISSSGKGSAAGAAITKDNRSDNRV